MCMEGMMVCSNYCTKQDHKTIIGIVSINMSSLDEGRRIIQKYTVSMHH